MGVEWTIWDKLCLIWALVYEKKKQKSKRMRKRWCLGGWWLRGQGHFVGRFRVRSASLKTFQTLWLAKHCLVLLFRDQLLYLGVQYIFTLDLMCMQYLCVSVIHWTMTQTTGSLTCLHDFLMHAYTHVFAFIFSLRLNYCLFGRGERLGACFFHSVSFFRLGEPLGPPLWNPRSNTANGRHVRSARMARNCSLFFVVSTVSL